MRQESKYPLKTLNRHDFVKSVDTEMTVHKDKDGNPVGKFHGRIVAWSEKVREAQGALSRRRENQNHWFIYFLLMNNTLTSFQLHIMTGLSRQTIAKHTKKLQKEGLICKVRVDVLEYDNASRVCGVVFRWAYKANKGKISDITDLLKHNSVLEAFDSLFTD